jgi:predicted homoserine dehydrogenase-like protein
MLRGKTLNFSSKNKLSTKFSTGPAADCCAVAKRELAPGQILDQIGEYTYRAWAMEAGRARAAQAHPAGVLTGAKVTAPIKKGELITAANTDLPDAKIVDLRRRQDEMLYGVELERA